METTVFTAGPGSGWSAGCAGMAEAGCVSIPLS